MHMGCGSRQQTAAKAQSAQQHAVKQATPADPARARFREMEEKSAKAVQEATQKRHQSLRCAG